MKKNTTLFNLIFLFGMYPCLFSQTNILPSSGNVGIGTATPKANLDVNGFLITAGHEANIGPNVNNDPNYYGGEKLNTILPNTGKLAIGWNRSAHKGETDFVSNRGYGSLGGFSFYDIDNSGNLYHILNLNSNGNASLYGKLEAKELKVTLTPTADFVFEEDYELPTLQFIEKHIQDKKHLPEIASAKEMEKEGLNIGEFQIKLLQKIEELTLYIIDQNKENQKQNERIEQLTKKLNLLSQKNIEL